MTCFSCFYGIFSFKQKQRKYESHKLTEKKTRVINSNILVLNIASFFIMKKLTSFVYWFKNTSDIGHLYTLCPVRLACLEHIFVETYHYNIYCRHVSHIWLNCWFYKYIIYLIVSDLPLNYSSCILTCSKIYFIFLKLTHIIIFEILFASTIRYNKMNNFEANLTCLIFGVGLLSCSMNSDYALSCSMLLNLQFAWMSYDY